jgi:mannose-6-phosphate isomerase-like protein (cupin superfamily)
VDDEIDDEVGASDVGGDPACWAHLLDDPDAGADVSRAHEHPLAVDLLRVTSAGRGAAWSLPHGGDLDANLVRLGSDDEIAEHVNTEVDVVMVIVDGSGEVRADGWSAALRPGVVVLVPRNCARAIRAGADGIGYLTVHRRRGPLQIGPHRSPSIPPAAH